jgi:hypothetical protein
MSEYEKWSLIIGCVQGVIFLIQAGFLIWYAIETCRMRKAAASQASTIAAQYGAMVEQNQILARQLATNTAALDQQRLALAAEEEARRIQREETIQSNEPLFTFNAVARNNGKVAIQFRNRRENVHIEDFRATQDFTLRGASPLSEHARLAWFDISDAVVYFGIQYRRIADSELTSQVFTINTQTGSVEKVDYDFNDLPTRH